SNIEPFPTDRRKTLCPPARRFSRGAAIQQPVKRGRPAAGNATRKAPVKAFSEFDPIKDFTAPVF
ncbi:MAG: hypothetical protein KIG21_00955, partial [Angelakisella sp.]|nr:hypothetical protein [Angelakisella sp.]